MISVLGVVMLGVVVAPVDGATRSGLVPTVVGTSLPDATQSFAYTGALAATGGTAPYTWSLLTGAVPLGLVLSSSGTISGVPGSSGATTIDVRVTDSLGESSTARISLLVYPAPTPPQQVTVATALGNITMQSATSTSVGGLSLGAQSFVGIADSPNGRGSWAVTKDGRVVVVGAVVGHGGLSTHRAKGEVVGIASNPTGTGYWIATRNGHVYGFGAARARGSLSGLGRRKGVAAIASAPHGGYYLLQATGKVTGFGGARTRGSVPARRDHVVIAGMTATASGSGYWIAATNGRVFRFGVARSYTLVGAAPTGVITHIATATTGIGFYLITKGGAIFSYGAALHLLPVSVVPGDQIVGIAAAV